MNTIEYKGFYIPKTGMGEKIKTPQDYINSGTDQVRFLTKRDLINRNTKILDFGCGVGRFLTALEFSKTDYGKYVGIDTQERYINWCNKHLQFSDKISFIHLPAHNRRYNKKTKDRPKLPREETNFDLIFLNSVFSHMLLDDIEFYLKEFYRVLDTNGTIYCTGFIEENVPDMEENPVGYLGKKISGSLHRVRYNKTFLIDHINAHGFFVQEFRHQGIKRTGQSILLLNKQTTKRNNQ